MKNIKKKKGLSKKVCEEKGGKYIEKEKWRKL